MAETKAIRSIHDLKVYQLAYRLAMELFEMTKTFPKEEMYSLTDQLRRSSRSVVGNIREGYAKRKYAPVFVRHLNHALGSSEETRTWIDLARDCGYLEPAQHEKLESDYDQLSAMVYALMERWETFETAVHLTSDV